MCVSWHTQEYIKYAPEASIIVRENRAKPSRKPTINHRLLRDKKK